MKSFGMYSYMCCGERTSYGTLDILVKDNFRSLFSGVRDLGYFSYVVLSPFWCAMVILVIDKYCILNICTMIE